MKRKGIESDVTQMQAQFDQIVKVFGGGVMDLRDTHAGLNFCREIKVMVIHSGAEKIMKERAARQLGL